jgi:hypothetical protein
MRQGPRRRVSDSTVLNARKRRQPHHMLAVACFEERRPLARTPSGSHPDGRGGTIMAVDPRALAPLVLLALALVGYCLYDIANAEQVRWLPRWAWALLCVLSIPLGPIAYLMLGRGPR